MLKLVSYKICVRHIENEIALNHDQEKRKIPTANIPVQQKNRDNANCSLTE